MRIIDIFEAPIGNIDIIGEPRQDWTNHVISKRDVGPLTSKRGMEKIRKTWEHIPWTFDFYIVVKKLDVDFDALRERANPNAISIILTNNVTREDNYLPFTAWILAHRIGHTLQVSSIPAEVRKNYRKFENIVFNLLLNRDYDEKGFNMVGVSVNSLKQLTMKSARTGKITNSLDFVGELLAQYLIRGSIKLNGAPQAENMLNKQAKTLFDSMVGEVLMF